MHAPEQRIEHQRYEHRQRTYEQSHERVECPVCQTIISRHNLPRHMRTIKCISYIKPEADVEAPPAVVDDPPAVVVTSTAYAEEYWSDGCSSNSSYGWTQFVDP